MRSELHRRGWRYRVDVRPERDLRTRADLVFPSRRVAVYVDGCFWHGCPDHYTTPATRGAWWDEKIATNRRRDKLATSGLAERGWSVVRVWEHQSTKDAVAAVEAALGPGLDGSS